MESSPKELGSFLPRQTTIGVRLVMKHKGQRRQRCVVASSSAVEYPLRLKLIGLHIKDVSFATDQTERHLEVENIGYENFDSLAKRRPLVSLVLFLRIYYKGVMLGEQSASLPRTFVLTEEQSVG
ncbi:hypothetical protein Fot_20358 [Forsythia ovata]|uniref:Uncharacterized protein n=1 Tax=Forsythia ovata TaxID=205694 RepID=A0ABD1VNP2_9LAMI